MHKIAHAIDTHARVVVGSSRVVHPARVPPVVVVVVVEEDFFPPPAPPLFSSVLIIKTR
tara:strand:- start:117 stop:293 length:177 start_codon:yes stop_codon:yes gene_type:complete